MKADSKTINSPLIFVPLGCFETCWTCSPRRSTGDQHFDWCRLSYKYSSCRSMYFHQWKHDIQKWSMYLDGGGCDVQKQSIPMMSKTMVLKTWSMWVDKIFMSEVAVFKHWSTSNDKMFILMLNSAWANDDRFINDDKNNQQYWTIMIFFHGACKYGSTSGVEQCSSNHPVRCFAKPSGKWLAALARSSYKPINQRCIMIMP